MYSIGKALCALVFKALIKIQVLGKENIPRKGGFILVSNHASNLDPVILGVASPRKLNFMAKIELFKNPIFGKILWSVNAFPVKRGKADISAIKEAIKRLKAGSGLLLFPQGERSESLENSQVQSGVGFLAAKSNVPVIPAFISGSDKCMPKGAKFIKPGIIKVRFGQEIHLERRMPYEDIARQVMDSIRHLSC